MTVKERLHSLVSEMSDEEAVEALSLIVGARAGATPSDVYGTAWGRVLEGTDPEAISVSGKPTIQVPDGIPDIR